MNICWTQIFSPNRKVSEASIIVGFINPIDNVDKNVDNDNDHADKNVDKVIDKNVDKVIDKNVDTDKLRSSFRDLLVRPRKLSKISIAI